MAGLFDWLGSGIEAGAEPQPTGLFGDLFGSGIEAAADACFEAFPDFVRESTSA
jgi:hypothetical protein